MDWKFNDIMNWNSQHYQGRWEELSDFYDYQLNENKMFKLNWTNVKSALVYVFLTAVLGLLMYVIGVGDVFKIDFHSVINIFAISIATGVVSIIKNLLTDNSGAFLGVTQVIPPTN